MAQALVAVAALVAGGALAWVVQEFRSRAALARLQAELASSRQQLTERTEELKAEKSKLAADLAARDGELTRQKTDYASLQTLLAEERKATEEKLRLVVEAERKLSDAFKALAADALRNNNQAFIDLATTKLGEFKQGAESDLEARQKAVDGLVTPIRESLEKVDGKLGELELARVSAYAALQEQLKGLVETHLPMLRSETANLVKALRQPSVRGRWGEIQLKRVVEMAGMVEYCDFLEQESRSTEDGRLRPDMIVKLPGGKSIVVDAKAPVSAYLNATEAPDEATQQSLLADHARQVRDHIVALGRKAYWDQFNPTPEFVVLFLPGEMFFSAALQQDPGLIEFGVNEKVIPATPTTLIALLRSVAYGWRQEALAQNAQEVAELGKQLYERIAVLAGHWTDVGSRLDKAVEAYNKSVGTLESRVLVTARRLRDLKAAPEDGEIDVIAPLDHSTRALQAPELSSGLAIPSRESEGSHEAG